MCDFNSCLTFDAKAPSHSSVAFRPCQSIVLSAVGRQLVLPQCVTALANSGRARGHCGDVMIILKITVSSLSCVETVALNFVEIERV